MQIKSDILKNEFLQDLLKDPKPCIIPYLKKEGPIITDENKSVIIEHLMIDYYHKKNEILKYKSDYQINDLKILNHFENLINNSIGDQTRIMHFYQFDPNEDPITQLENVMKDPDFHSWAIC